MTSFVLKLIAILAMLADHIAKVFGQEFTGIFFPDSLEASYNMMQIMEIMGRLTFPLMAFFIAEGCRKTSNITKYIMRLLGFAFLSQIPYTLALYATNGLGSENPHAQFGTHITFFDIGSPNVLFTLAFGALAIFLYEKLRHKPVSFVFAALIIAAAGLLKFEYSFFGVLLIFVAYALPARKTQILGMAIVLSVLYLGYGGGLQNALNMFDAPRPLAENIFHAIISGVGQWFGALASLLLLYFYNGERGKKAKYSFYIFYPAHLLVLAVIREMIRYF
ncbi:MAG: conjugal transfer protein TraX [Oscillospiraceae bacterium]|nr:conjugal transfer protein TraX [Oscillospiraceae bacterium]